jgi:hypothetical protein
MLYSPESAAIERQMHYKDSFYYPHRLVTLYPSLYKKRPPFLNCCAVGMSKSKASARRSMTLKEKQTYMASSMACSDTPEERMVAMSAAVTCCGCSVNFCKNPKTLRNLSLMGAVCQLSNTAGQLLRDIACRSDSAANPGGIRLYLPTQLRGGFSPLGQKHRH